MTLSPHSPTATQHVGGRTGFRRFRMFTHSRAWDGDARRPAPSRSTHADGRAGAQRTAHVLVGSGLAILKWRAILSSAVVGSAGGHFSHSQSQGSGDNTHNTPERRRVLGKNTYSYYIIIILVLNIALPWCQSVLRPPPDTAAHYSPSFDFVMGDGPKAFTPPY